MNWGILNLGKLLTVLAIMFSLTGCTSMQHIDDSKIIDSRDPWETSNRKIYNFNDSLDQNFFRPLASTYVKVTPQPLRIGITNFFENLNYLNVILNNSLQGKIDQSASDIVRFVFNSTFGVGGLFDVATPMGLVAHNEDLGQTLAVWGSRQGPYLNLPAYGPSTARDLPDFASSYFLNPFSYLAITISLPAKFLEIINTRANLLDASDFRDSAALDPYSFTREAYLQSRRNMIYDGNPPTQSIDDIFDLDFEDASF